MADADADNSLSWWTWGTGAYKTLDTRRIGDLRLSSMPAGRVTGSAHWASGLPYTKPLHELLGGTIATESEVSSGTTFTVRLPATETT